MDRAVSAARRRSRIVLPEHEAADGGHDRATVTCETCARGVTIAVASPRALAVLTEFLGDHLHGARRPSVPAPRSASAGSEGAGGGAAVATRGW